jgi:L-alanine-DL-glutamate epimerase-like enolase superfamily enzyme
MSGPLVELEWATAALPLRRPLQAGALVITSREYCCVRATLASGAVGETFVMTRGLDVADAVGRLFAARAVGSTAGALDGLRSGVRNVGWDGAISRAASAIRLAALDAAAREQGIPAWQALGAAAAPSARAAVVVGYATPGQDPGDADVRGAQDAVEAGATLVKLMGGAGTPEDDLRRLARVRQAVGAKAELALDVNGAWPQRDALVALPRLAEAGVALVEEPWAYEHGLAGFDGLPAERPELAFGEISASIIELEALAATGCVEHLRPDATLVGGAEAWRRLAPVLAKTGIAVFPHFWPEIHRHLIALVPRASYLECTLPGGDEFGLEGLVSPGIVLDDGRVVAPDTPGFGFALDWERVRHHADTEPHRHAA